MVPFSAQNNTFQSVLITDGIFSFVTYLYADGLIQWTTGDASGGVDGLGGSPAQCGFDAGDQMRYLTHPDSGTGAIINITMTTNVNILGQWSFRVDENSITEPPSMSKHCILYSYRYLLLLSFLLDTDSEGAIGSDPHFAIRLPGGLLCYNFQGLHNTIFNLLGNDHLQMNALFVPDDTNWDNTWLGSIGIVVLHDGQKMTTLQLTAADHLVRIGERARLDARTVEKLSFNNGKLTMDKVPSNHTRKYPRVQVEFVDSKLDFTIGFTKESHLDLYWHNTGIPSKSSTGIVGRFTSSMISNCLHAYLCLILVAGHFHLQASSSVME